MPAAATAAVGVDAGVDEIEEYFGYLIGEWEKRCKRKSQLKEMKLFIRKECHKWSEWANKLL